MLCTKKYLDNRIETIQGKRMDNLFMLVVVCSVMTLPMALIAFVCESKTCYKLLCRAAAWETKMEAKSKR